MSSVLFDLGNLNGGGGVQVGASLLDELARLLSDSEASGRYGWLTEHLVIEASPLVCQNASDAAVHDLPITVVNREPGAIATWVPARKMFDVAFTLFGPAYGPRRGRRHIVGFADLTSLHPKLASPGRGSTSSRAKGLARRSLSRWYFRRADRLIVEAPHVATDLTRLWGIPESKVSVVPNAINAVFDEANIPAVELQTHLPTFCYITRAYPHKNLEVLLPALRELKLIHDLEAVFVLTLKQDEWAALPLELRKSAINLGPLPIEDVPAIYAGVTGSVFSSKLEAFSVTPLEALASGCALIASDRPFVRSVAGDAATYVDPDDARGWADAMAAVIRGDPGVSSRVERGVRIAKSWPTAADRARAYVDILDNERRAAL